MNTPTPTSFSWADESENMSTDSATDSTITESTAQPPTSSPYGSAKPVTVKVSEDFVSSDFDPRKKNVPDCRNFRKTGTCPRGSLCRFRHDPSRIKKIVKSTEPVRVDNDGFEEVQAKRVLNTAYTVVNKGEKKESVKTQKPKKPLPTNDANSNLSVNVYDILNETDD